MSENLLLIVGSVNRPAPYFATANGSGVSAYQFNAEKSEITELASVDTVENPTFLSVCAETGRVYVNSEIYGWREGLVSAYAFDAPARRFEYINMQASLGSITAQNILSRDRRHLLVVNYGMGDGGPDQSLVIFPIMDSGAVGPAVTSVRQAGIGPDPDRQERSHAHSVIEISANVFIVADLGCDTLTSYRLTDDSTLELLYVHRCAAGAGPRHMALHPDGQFLFVINELNSTCASYKVTGGELSLINTVFTTREPSDRQGNHCADLQVSSDGRHLYGSNRGHDSIALFSVDQSDGTIALVETFPCGGRTPRNLAISPSGRHVFSANQDSDHISIFIRDAESGNLVDTGQRIETGTPVCIKITA